MESQTKELLMTSCRDSQQWSACLWDFASTNILHFYKNGGTVAPKTLNLLGDEYVLSADSDKPVIHVWPLNSQEPTKKLTTVLPEKANTLTVCPRTTYLVAGLGTKLYVWHMSSGKLFSIQKRNFQPITSTKFSGDGNYLAVTGQDGMLVVYDFISLVRLDSSYVSGTEIGQMEPVFVKCDNTMPVMDVHVGSFGPKSRVATVSSDHTCRLYNLSSGELLSVIVFKEPLTCVIFDGPCWNLYVGESSGKIQQVCLKRPPRNVEHHVEDDLVFGGHTKQVTCLHLNMANTNLASGSDDHSVIIWDIQTRQVLKRIQHKAEITCVQFVLNHKNFFVQTLKPKLVFKNLDKELNNSDVYVVSKFQDYDIEMSDEEDTEGRCDEEVQAENSMLRTINRQLYDAAIGLSRKYNDF